MLNLLNSWNDPNVFSFLNKLIKSSQISGKQILQLSFLYKKIKPIKSNQEDTPLVFFLIFFLLEKKHSFTLKKDQENFTNKFLSNLNAKSYAPIIKNDQDIQEETLIVYYESSDDFIFQTKKSHLYFKSIEMFLEKNEKQFQWKKFTSLRSPEFLKQIQSKTTLNSPSNCKIITSSIKEYFSLQQSLKDLNQKKTNSMSLEIQMATNFFKECTSIQKKSLSQNPFTFFLCIFNTISLEHWNSFLSTLHSQSKIILCISSFYPNIPLKSLSTILSSPPTNNIQKSVLQTKKISLSHLYKENPSLQKEISAWLNRYIVPEIKNKQKKIKTHFNSLKQNTLTDSIVQNLIHFKNQMFYTDFNQIISFTNYFCHQQILKEFNKPDSEKWLTGTPILLKRSYPDLNLFKNHQGIIIGDKNQFVLFEEVHQKYQILPLLYLENEITSPYLKNLNLLDPYSSYLSNALLIEPKKNLSFDSPIQNLKNHTSKTTLHIKYVKQEKCF